MQLQENNPGAKYKLTPTISKKIKKRRYSQSLQVMKIPFLLLLEHVIVKDHLFRYENQGHILCWTIWLISHLSEVVGNASVFPEIWLFDVINLNIYISLQEIRFNLLNQLGPTYECCYFEVRKLAVIRAISIPLGIDPAPFWTNLDPSKHVSNFMSM